MPRIKYQDIPFAPKRMEKIALCNEILLDYAAQGFDLTLRQLYYQMVTRNYIANNDREYNNLGKLVSDARLAGLIDWDSIVDRVRQLRKLPSWGSPSSIIRSAADSFRMDRWLKQDYVVEVWIEKNALIGVIDPICTKLDIPYFACIGYNSQSEAWRASQRVLDYLRDGKTPVILHLGDHDPSGRDMTRDIIDRFNMFLEVDCAKEGIYYDGFQIDRLALNMDQIQQYDPPPNPTKLTDSRATGYIAEFGYDCWELDALSPAVINDLIEDAVMQYVDEDAWDEIVKEEEEGKELLKKASSKWSQVVSHLETL